jgi:parallel beta-helix repeat protein
MKSRGFMSKGINITMVLIMVCTCFAGIFGFVDDFVNEAEGITVPLDYPTIQSAIDNALDGETIYVWAGTYTENVLVNKMVTLIGNGSTDSIIDGSGGNVVNIQSDWVNITGFNITNGNDGIYFSSFSNITISGNNITMNNHDGIFLQDSSNYNKIFKNNISESFFGIEVKNSCNYNTISENNIFDNHEGMWLQISCNFNTISNNNITSNNYDGIDLSISSNNNTISGNNITSNNEDGIDLSSSCNYNNITNNNVSSNIEHGIHLYQSPHNLVENNNVFSNIQYGIRLVSSSNSNITGNDVFLNTQDGISLNSASNTSITGNNVSSNSDDGISLYISSNSNTVSGNIVSSDVEGILVVDSSNNNITNNIVSMSINGIFLYNSSNNNVIDNNLSWNTYGITSILSDNNTFFNNTATNNEYGIYFDSSIKNTIANNTISNNDYGIYLISSNSNIITNNTVSLNDLRGIYLSSSNDNTITNNTALENGFSIMLSFSESNTIANNTITNVGYGLYLTSSNDNKMVNNIIFSKKDYYGILLGDSSNCTIIGNIITENSIYITGSQVSYWNTHTIDTSNTVNDKPVYYWKDQIGGTVPSGAGEVILANCTNIIVENQNLSNQFVGIELGFSNNITMANNTASNNTYSVSLHFSSGNTITNNTVNQNKQGITLFLFNLYNNITNNMISNNSQGITLGLGTINNSIYHNNLYYNVNQVTDPDSNQWDDGYPSGGNYWSDYKGIDSDGDGIGDTPYVIDSNSQDNYPLMNPFDETLPEITDVIVVPQPQKAEENVNISARVVDNIKVFGVWVEIHDPYISLVDNFTMQYDAINGRYFLNRSYALSGEYTYKIWANDTADNWVSRSGIFFMEDIRAPSIMDISILPSVQKIFFDVNISANITDDIEIFGAWVEVHDPDANLIGNFSMVYDLDTDRYYLNQTYDIPGISTFTIWTVDTTDHWSRFGRLIRRITGVHQKDSLRSQPFLMHHQT